MNNSLQCEHGANNAEGGGMRVPTSTLHGQRGSSVRQSYYSDPLAFCGITILRCVMRRAFGTVTPFSSLQAWPEGWLEPTSRGTQSLLAPKPCGALASFQLLQGSRTTAGLRAAYPGGAQRLVAVLEAMVSN